MRLPRCGSRSGVNNTASRSSAVKHLALAIAYEPSNVLARGLAGLVAHQGKWKSPAELEKDLKTDAAIQQLIHEYLDRRLGAA